MGERKVFEVPEKRREDIWIRSRIGHFGVRVKNLGEAARELKAKRAESIWKPREIREDVRVTSKRGPEDDVIEIMEGRKTF